MSRIPHDSSLIQATDYNEGTRELHVELLHKGTYKYADVPPEDVHELRNSDSIGGHFNKVFKAAHGHKAEKVG